MALRPSLTDLSQLTDPAEREYVAAKRGSVSDDQLLDDLHQYRIIQAANNDEGRASIAPAEEPTASADNGPPLPETTGQTGSSTGVPTFEEFYRDVAPLNPGYTRSQIEGIYQQHFGETPDYLPTLEEFHADTKPLNPDYSDDQIREVWWQHFGSKGALEKTPGVLGTLEEGAKSALRNISVFGKLFQDDRAGIEELGREQAEAPRDPRLQRFFQALEKQKTKLGPDSSWFETGVEFAKAAANDPTGAGLAFMEQLPNTGLVMGSAGAGALLGSALGPLGTIAGGIAGLFVSEIGLESGAKAIEKSAGGMTPMERAEALMEGAAKGSVTAATDVASFGATNWLMRTGARAMEAATIRTLEKEGIDVTDRAAIEAATKDPALVDKVRQSQTAALQAANTLPRRLGRGALEVGIESFGEGLGEYVGELAATGKADKMEAVLEAFAGFSQSAVELGLSSTLSRQARTDAIFGGKPDPGTAPITNITSAPTVDDAIKQAGAAVGEAPPIDNQAIDRFIQGEKGTTSDAQHAIDTQAFQDVLAGVQSAKRLDNGMWMVRGVPVSAKVFRPEELPDEAPDGKTVTKSVYEALNTVLGAQGRRLVVFEDNARFEGVVRRAKHPDVVFISQKTTVDPVVVAFHEAAHLMQGTPLYKSYQQVLFSELKKGAKGIAKERHGAKLSDTQLINEISADIAGDAMTDPLFMEKVFTRLREQVGEATATKEAQSFLDRLKAMIIKAKDFIRGKTFTTRHGERIALKYVKNLERVHDALATAVADLYYNKGKVETSRVDNIDDDYAEDARRQGEERLILPPDVAKEFERVGATQRGAPEEAMVRVQEAMDGGVLNPVVEHAGDLLHRMTHMASSGTALTPYVQEKTDRVLNYLTSAYGFEKEMVENIAGNANYYKKSPKEWAAKVDEALAQYANEHAKLPVYNFAQWLAKHAAIAIGRKQWKLAIEHLRELKKLADGDEFTAQAFKYTHDADRKLIPYERPIKVAYIGKTPSGSLRVMSDLETRKYHIVEDLDGFKAGTKISGKELKERGYKPDVVDVISHEEDQTVRDLHKAGIAEASPRSDAGHKRKGTSYVGAPSTVKNPQGLVKLRERLLKLAKEGAPGKQWYEESGKAILEWAEGDRALAEKIIGLLAIYSPMQAVSPNTSLALRAYYQWASGEKITVVNTLGAPSAARAQAWMDGTMNEREITGVKRSNFYINLMREVNPEMMPAEVQGVTVDMWMARAMGYFSTAVSEQQYKFAEREIKRVAAKLGWEPQQVQAAIWVAIKSRIEAVYNDVREQAKKNGWLKEHVYMGKDGQTSTGWVPKDGESRVKFERALLAAALEIPLPDITKASYNYADALHERIAQISWEATPGRSTGILPGIHTASYGQQAEYLDAIDKALRNEDGQDKIGILVKLAGANTILGPGAWKGGSSPGAQTMTAMGTTRDGLKRVVVSPEGRKIANLYADIRGYVMYQEGVYWHYPIFDEAKKNSNGVEIDVGRPLTPEEMMALYRDIMTWAGHDEWAPAFTERGARIVNFKDSNHLGFQETIKTALQTFPLDHTFRVFRVEGDARTNDWKEFPHGEEYRQRIRAAGGPDLLRAVEDLRQAVDRVNQTFSDKYGWGNTQVGVGGSELSRTVARPYSEAGRAGVDLQGLPTPVDVDGRPVEFHGFKPAQDAARRYMERAGLPYNPETVYHPLNKERATRIANAYEAMEHRPNDPEVKAAYRALIDETVAQYREIEKTGLKVEFIKGEDPYGNPRNAIIDIVENNHFWVYSTRDGFGSSAFDPAAHPLLEETDITISGQKALANDIFRIVHDYFGHVKDGVGFRAEGEDNAWYSHMRMFSPAARRALTSETRGQNSWVNFGPFGEKNRKASPAETTYADQKAGLLPEWAEEVDEAPEFSAKEPPFGIAVDALPADAKAPNVNWEHEQAQNWITNKPEDWKGTGWGTGTPVVYRAYIPNELMPQVRSSVNVKNDYDWNQFKKTGQYPPIVLVLHQNGSARKLEDGHHRVTYWREKGFDHFPAWIVDFRRSAKRKMADEGSVLSPAPIFVSSVIKTLDAKLPARASGQQIRNMLKNTPGVKEDEILWMGLDDFLKSKEMFTKQEVLDFARANQVEIREVEKGKGIPTVTVRQNKETQEYEVIEVKSGRVRASFNTQNEAIEYIDENERTRLEETKFPSYQLPGGADYRELLLTLSTKPILTSRILWSDFERDHPQLAYRLSEQLYAYADRELTNEELTNELNNLLYSETYEDDRVEKTSRNVYRQIREAYPEEVKQYAIYRKSQENTFRSSHWPGTPNVLAHVRFNTREVDGKKVLFLEEVQSDWHQKGRREGYAPERTAPAGWANTGNAVSTGRGVPDAPFKTTWHELALRRMLRYAAENGTPGNSAWNDVTKPESVGEQFEKRLGRELASVSPLKVVNAAVLGGFENDKVRRAVIEAIPVDVMNVLAKHGFTAKRLEGDLQMLGKALPVPVRATVARGFADALELVGTRLRTALDRILSSDSSGRDRELYSAIRASDLDARVVVGLLSPVSIYGSDRGTTSESGSAGAGAKSTGAVSSQGELAGVRRELPPAELADALNRHNAILQGSSDNGNTKKYIPPSGYAYLAWTPGSIQAERYDLSKQIDVLHWARQNDRYTIKAKVIGESGFTDVAKDIPESALVEYVGKDLAQKIIDLKGKKWTGEFKEVDLKVGGEGMKGFYDKILPAYLNKYGKKWGAKVEPIALPVDSDLQYVGPTYSLEELKAALPILRGYRDVYISPFTKQRVSLTGPINNTTYTKQLKDIITNFEVNDQNDATFRQLVSVYGSHGMAEILGGKLEQVPELADVHSLPITDAMRQSVVDEGQPLFSLKDNERALTLQTQRTELESNIEAIQTELRYARTDEETKELEETLDLAERALTRFERQHPEFSPRTIPAASYTVDEPGRLDKFVRILQDKNIDIKRVVESIKAAGGVVPDDLNPVLKEEMYQKRAQTRSEDFTNKELKPLLEIMRANKISLDAFDKYAHARHVIDDRLNSRLQAMNPDLPNNEALSGMTDEEAQKILDSYTGQRADLMRNLMVRLDAMINETRNLMVSYGLEKADRIQQWREQYQSYVPLRRTPYEEEGHPTGTGRSVRGSTVRERLGSTQEVSSILANVAQARDQIITRGEKMRPVVAMAGLMMLHPNKGFASLDKPATIEMTDPLTGLTSTVPGDLATYKVPRIRRVDPVTGLVTTYPDPTYKGRDNVVNFRINGVDYAIVFNENNERAIEAAKAFRELETGKLTGILAAVAPYTRYLASINTQYNPIFGIVNFIRDAQFAMFTLASTPLAGKQSTIVKNALASLAGIYQDARDSRLGLPPSSATAQMWERFTHVGGPTGYRDLFFTATDRAKEIERLLNPNSWKHIRSPQDFGRRVEDTALFKLLSDYNLTMENAIRLGVFKTAVEDGVSDLQAASYAKNITVNFNKRGQIGAQMGALYAFFNASVQGTARILETLFERKGEEGGYRLSAAGKKIVVGGLLIGILQTVALALAGFDDDEPPEFVKQKNLVFPMPGTEKGYLMIPMPLGFNLIPNVGRLAAESMIAIAKGNPRSVFTKGYHLFESMAETLSPTGGAGDVVAELSPTVADPFVALKANRDWTGKEIYKEDRSSLTPTPGHTRAKDTATVWAVAMAKAINWATGGTDYTPGVLSPSPDAIDYLIQQATGGVGREVSKAAQVVQTAVSGEELPLHKVPLLGRFGGSSTGAASIRDKFYDTVRSVNIAAEEIKGRALHHEEISSALASHPEARFEKAAIQVERQLGELRKAKQLAIERGASREAIRMRDQQMTTIMQRFNAAVEAARKSR